MPSIVAALKPLAAIGAAVLALGLLPAPAQAGKAGPKVRFVTKQFVVHPQISTQRTSNTSASAPRSGQSGKMSR
jgi:hypothetical protein